MSLRVLILHASTGNGHRSAALALETVLKAEGVEVRVEDTLTFAPQGFRYWYAGGYEMLVRRAPRLWGVLYRDSDRLSPSFHFQTQLDLRFLSRLDNLIKEWKPDWIVCTHSLPQPRLQRLRKEGVPFRFGVVVTDLHPQWMWLRGEPDAYFVPEAWTEKRLLERLPSAVGKIHVTGIPVHPSFVRKRSREEVRREMGLVPEIPTLLLTAGGIGGGPFVEVIDLLSALPVLAQVIIVCGRNEALYEKLAQRLATFAEGSRVRFVLKGHVKQEEMASCMHASDFMVGKPGGLTSSECMVAGCPMLIYAPFMIPGQEEQNADSLVENGAGLLARDMVTLSEHLVRLLSGAEERTRMQEQALKIGHPHAAEEIAKVIFSSMEKDSLTM